MLLFAKKYMEETDIMLTYEEFKSAFCAKFPEMMGPEFAGYEMKMMPVVKKGKCLLSAE